MGPRLPDARRGFMRRRNPMILQVPPGTRRFGRTVRRIRLMIAPLIRAQAGGGGTRRQKIAAWRTAWLASRSTARTPPGWRR
jgi:hypothetical protein